ncbi:hypothetical protein P3X46_004151 [Hevea brasiliensis]|uniref:C2H2-type domain-containing protein n=1 Tax=Hevea brasiliensis TaxID=3981 RepID=A0ABQ9MY56_HEVBR|nr:histone deacetylase HDT1 [Hevea brasiliensis]KAJ9184423.1 hypothetical protein P3X46_004151 [Hevea brasiliensis]
MEFWGTEVKSGEPLVIEIGGDFILHLSQACLGEVKKDKGNESVFLYAKINDKKHVLGMLSPEKFPQISFDLVFDKDVELSHNWKNGSVYFSGYKIAQAESDDDSEPLFEIEEDLPVATNNGKPESESKKTKPLMEKTKPNSNEPKQKVKIIEPHKDDKPNEETDESSDDSSDDDESSDDQGMTAKGEDEEDDESDDEDDESDDEDEEEPTRLKAEQGKKRSAEPAKKIPIPDKKAKLVTPQKTDGKKVVGHVATPHPSKQIVKTPANKDQKKEQTLKSFACASCNRSFGSEVALQSHTKAKHSAAQ